MSLQDDIARYANKYRTVSFGLTDHIAAALERDYYLVKLADLPEVTEAGPGAVFVDGLHFSSDEEAEFYLRMAYRNIAVVLHLQARESEAAVLARRRDELARELSLPSYEVAIEAIKVAINKVVAAEAEVARLKGERG